MKVAKSQLDYVYQVQFDDGSDAWFATKLVEFVAYPTTLTIDRG
jgi:hypothetical protein